MKEQIILEILHLLPQYTSDQLYEIKEAARIVLCRYDISAKSTALQPALGRLVFDAHVTGLCNTGVPSPASTECIFAAIST